MTLLVSMAGCAPTNVPERPTPIAPPANAGASDLRLLDISPIDGSQVDSATVIVATLAYHIADFDPEATYMVFPVFGRSGGGSSNQGGGRAQIRSPLGIITIQHSLDRLLTGGPSLLETPLTGSFYLAAENLPPVPSPPVEATGEIQVRTVVTRSLVEARTRTFYFNGPSPARSLSAGLLNVLEDYWALRTQKAFALAYDGPDRMTHGYAFGYPSIEAAQERALEECRVSAERREVLSPCRIILTNDEQEP